MDADLRERASYTEKLKVLIDTGLSQGDHLSRIQAEGKLAIMEHFVGELDQAREWIKFLEILQMYGQAKDERDQAGIKPNFFGRKQETELGRALRQLQSDIYSASGAVRSLELRARM